MATTPTDDEDQIAGHGVIVRAANGDVIRYDPTGVVLRLSDRVIADIALRLGASPPEDAPAQAARPDPKRQDGARDDLLDDVDAWGVTQDGDWMRFTARMPGAQGPRGFRRHIDGGTILGDGPGAVMGILGLGGPRAALATTAPSAFPHHIVAAADDIGAVGMAGIALAPETDRLEPLRETPQEALVAETILYWQMDKFAPLPLIVTRVETDNSACAADLARGRAVENLIRAAQNLKAAAALMGKRAKILGICLDYALEHVTGDATAYRDGMLAVMARLTEGLARLGYEHPLFIARFEAGLDPADAAAVIAGQWELAWNHGDHRLIFAAPSYAFARDSYDRPTDAARRQMAELTAAALAEGQAWRCPTLFLAEWEPGGAPVIRVTAQADGPLVLTDPDDTGFALSGDSAVVIETVALADDDPQAVLITTSAKADGLSLSYGAGRSGGLRDAWAMQSRTGAMLHRWALPAILPIRGGRDA